VTDAEKDCLPLSWDVMPNDGYQILKSQNCFPYGGAALRPLFSGGSSRGPPIAPLLQPARGLGPDHLSHPLLSQNSECTTPGTLYPAYTIQPVGQPAGQPVVSCKQTSNRLHNRLDACLRDATGCTTSCPTGWTTGFIMKTNIQPVV